MNGIDTTGLYQHLHGMLGRRRWGREVELRVGRRCRRTPLMLKERILTAMSAYTV